MKQKVIYLFLTLIIGLTVLAPNNTFAQQDQELSDSEQKLIQLIEEGNTEQATQILEEMDPPNQEPTDEELQAALDEDIIVVGLEANGSDLQVALAWNPQKDRPQSAQLQVQDREGKAVAEADVETLIREQVALDEDAPNDGVPELRPQANDVITIRVADALKDVDSKGLRYEMIITDESGKELTRYPYHVMIACEDEENCSYEVFGGISTDAILISEELDSALDEAEREEPEDILATVMERHPDLTGDVYALSLQLAILNGTDETDLVRVRCACWWTAVVSRTPATASFFNVPSPATSVLKAGWEGPGAAHYFAAKSVGGSTSHWTTGSTKLTMKMRCWGIVGWTVQVIVIHFPWGPVKIKIYIPIFGYCPPQCDGKVEQSVSYLGHTTADTAGNASAAAYDRADYRVNGTMAAGFPLATSSWATTPGMSDSDFGFQSANVSTAQPSTAVLNTLGAVGVWAQPSSSACAKVVNGFIMSATATASCTLPNTVTASMLGAHPSHTRYLWWDLQHNVLDRFVCERELQTPGDLGDAPDSSNHFNVKMSAYPTTAARYPTVFDVTAPDVPGPMHWDAHGDAWLGEDVTLEKDADQTPDEDPTTNLIPVNDQANLDKADDGVRLDTVSIPKCGRTQFDYDVNVVGANQRRYVNVWFDYNRDGDWKDLLYCESANGTIIEVAEWSVRQHVISLGPGYHTETTPYFAAMGTPSRENPMWMRITLSDAPVPTVRHDFEFEPIDEITLPVEPVPVDRDVITLPPISASRPLTIAPPLLFRADGRGPDNGYEYGETEDYYLNRNPLPGEICGKKWDDRNGNGVQDAGEPGIPNWTIHVYNTAGNLIGTTTTLIGGGEYCFTLPPGTYVVGEALQPGWVQTFPAPPGTHTVNLGANQSIVNIDFGNQRREQTCVTPPRAMTAWWTLDETSGMIAGDIAGFPNDGLHMNGPTFSPGMVAGALTFDGVNDHIKVDSHSELNFGTSDFTIDAWIRTDDASGFRPIVDKRNPGPTDLPFGYSFYLQDGLLGFRINTDIAFGSGTFAGDISTGPNLADGEWHFVAVTVERGSTTGGKLYVDGTLIHTFDMTPLIGDADNNSPLIIASRNRFFGPPVDNFFDGQLDEIEIFHRDLTADEILSIYQAGRLGKCKDEIAGGEIHGTKWHDTNGNGVRDREEGLRGWTIIVTNEAGTSYSTTTDANGNYWFMNLPPGKYQVTEVIQPGWSQTFPKKGMHEVKLEAGEVIEGLDFGNWRENDGSCHVGWDINVFNTNSNTIEVGMNISNQSAVDANYQLNIVGSPTMIVHGFTATTPFDPGQPLPTPPVFVPANGNVYVALFMSPLPTILGPSGQYQVIVTDPATGRSFGCSAQLWQNDDVGIAPLNDILIAEVAVDEPQEVVFEVHNLGDKPLELDLHVEQMFGLPGREIDVLRFEMMAQPLLPLEPGDVMKVPVKVELMERVAGAIGDLILFADIDGDQRPDVASSVIIKAADDVPPHDDQAVVVLGDADSTTMQVMKGQRIEIPVSVQDIPTGIEAGAATLEVGYDATQLKPTSCINHPDGDFASVICNMNFAPGVVRLNSTSKVGIANSGNMALIEWEAIGSAGDSSDLLVDVKTMADVDASPLDTTVHNQKIEIVRAAVRGDVGCDGRVDSADALFILQFDVGMRDGAERCLQLERQERTVYLPACDLNNDGVCGSVDALLVLQCDVGIPNLFCPQEVVATGRSEPEATANSMLRLDHPEIANGDTFTLRVMTEADIELGAATVELNYDPAQFAVIDCQISETVGGNGFCKSNYQENIVRFNAVMEEGASGPLHLADINLKHIGDTVDASGFSLTPITYVDVNIIPADVTVVEKSNISTTDSGDYMIYLPTIQK